MSVNIDYHNVRKIELLPIEVRTLGISSNDQQYSIRKLIIHIGDRKHQITLFGAELDSLDIEGEWHAKRNHRQQESSPQVKTC